MAATARHWTFGKPRARGSPFQSTSTATPAINTAALIRRFNCLLERKQQVSALRIFGASAATVLLFDYATAPRTSLTANRLLLNLFSFPVSIPTGLRPAPEHVRY